MKYCIILASFLVLSGCKTNAQKLNVTTIYSETDRVTKEVPETGAVHTYTTRKEVTKRLNPMIVMTSKNAEILKFRIQGNISSGGLNINKIRKIRFEKGQQNGNNITLRYFAEVKKIPGKEGSDVVGYNYTKDETYKIPGDVKIIKIELYEDRIKNTSGTTPKLIAEQTFNFFAKI
ncbi:hypothetical protein ACFU8T_09140 [Sphingobacterium spiritivorum]|uniref:Lipoprotein n=1 Tax=Sphingobacterium spiritivorum ATCC 33861 TaxID=525373 RepID=D7VSD9_SPHSI|nr:hypothetical protein [Sphingobacterium spiritivorum]EFK56690.1 hypothetical protein HMPREF0766_13893 [Sphingobacterium spiritivorum ATCC 33861]QQT35269.1 hypothetical protein I6J01_18585 [Sphingobacterium spiritivorum]WQD36184.1 hypothetical protein U0038_10535 [Sphingobacterium spiritivorum]SUJ04433.1 Uncharacterised protein [Sphingobacterium spiritivorum]